VAGRAQVARDLGVHVEPRRLWVKQAAIDAGRREGLTSDDKADLTRRREDAVVRQERAIRKQAAALFARASVTRCAAPGSSRPRRPSTRSRSPVGCSGGRARASTPGAGDHPRRGPGRPPR
jgi:transposase-like protein